MPNVTIQPDATAGKDDTLRKDGATVTTGFGTTTQFNTGADSANVYARGIIKFPLTDIPQNSVITLVQFSAFEFSASGTGSRIIRLKRILQTWEESTVNATTCNVGGVCYGWRVYNTVAWGSEGCGLDGVDRAAGDLSTLDLDGTSANAFVTWPTSADLVTCVQNWLDGVWENYGFLIQSDAEGNATTKGNNFYSSDYATATDRPKLYVEYDVGPVNLNMSPSNSACLVPGPRIV